jgi:uncharacterized protein
MSNEARGVLQGCSVKRAVVLGVLVGISSGCAHTNARDSLRSASDAIEAEQFETAARYLAEGSRAGDLRCDFLLGVLTLTGVGVERDAARASELLRKAAVAGLPVAQAILGVLYANGEGVEKDEKAAALWFRSAAEHGDPLGQAALGAASFLGQGVPEDPLEAYMWTSLAATQGNEKARAFLPAMEASLSQAELRQAKAMAARFEPEAPARGERVDRKLPPGFGPALQRARRSLCAHYSECPF